MCSIFFSIKYTKPGYLNQASHIKMDAYNTQYLHNAIYLNICYILFCNPLIKI